MPFYAFALPSPQELPALPIALPRNGLTIRVHAPCEALNERALSVQAALLLEQKAYAAAKPLFETLCQHNSFQAESWFGLARCQDALGDYEAATRSYKRCLHLAPTHSGAGFAMAVSQEEAGAFEAALVGYRQVLQQDATYLPALNNSGSCALQLGHYGLAERFFEQVLALQPFFSRALFGLALAKDGLEKEQEATWWFQAYLKQQPHGCHAAFVRQRLDAGVVAYEAL